MTDDKIETTKDTEEEVMPLPPIDDLLQLLVIFGNLGLGFPVTLSVKGTTITGTIIPATKYMERLAAKIRDPANKMPPDQDPAAFKKLMDTVADGLDKMKAAWEKTATDDPHMIHLDNVAVYEPTIGIIPIKGGLWRGRLDSVDGFIFGDISINRNDPDEIL